MLDWADDLKLRSTPLYLDGRTPRPLSLISHAHSDHIAAHTKIIATPITTALSSYRLQSDPAFALQPSTFVAVPFHTPHPLDNDTIVELLPAGHVLGSAMLHVTRPEGTLLYTGDFTLQSSLTAEAPAPRKADYLVMETTYGLPHFKFPPRNSVVDQLLSLIHAALKANRQPILLGYSLGKAQELTKILTNANLPVTLHGAPYNLNQIYDQHLPPSLGTYRKYAFDDFHGPAALPLEQRGVLIAPPHVARTSFINRFPNPLSIMMTGWALLKGAQFRYGVDHCLPFSDHADFPQLLELIDRVQPKHVYTHHGYTREFADHLRKKGIDARPAIPDAQLSLFE